MSERLKALADAGVSIWLDDLSRERIETGNLAELMKSKSVVGVTTNPTIFAAAIADGERYDDQVRSLVQEGADVTKVIFELTTEDVRNACDVLAPAAEGDGADGRVSIEVEPDLANDTDGTIASAKALWAAVDKPNVLIKIPATKEGLPAIRAAVAQGISVNVTLIFSTDRYREVMDAYLLGLEQARDAGLDLSTIQSVASFFVSRVDSEVDKRLEEIGGDEALALRGKAAVANARLAYAAYEDVIGSERWRALAAAGATPQRPLWASTGVKNDAYPDTLYVTELVVADTVNTMPEKTMDAFADHGEVEGDRVSGREAEAVALFAELEQVGVDFDDVLLVLEDEGVEQVQEVLARAGRDRQGADGAGAAVSSWNTVSGEGYEMFFGYADEPAFAGTVQRLVEDRVASRLGARDHTLWGADAEAEAGKRLAWVDLARSGRALVPEIESLRDELRARGLTHIVLCGMGGSSLAPEVICEAQAVELSVVDSSDPDFVRDAIEDSLAQAVVVVSSKSGGTVETDSQRRAFEKAFTDAGIDPAERLVVVTDPGSPLEESARDAGYRVFLADPGVGGRYSALTAFGLVPSGLAGADLGALLDSADAMHAVLLTDSVDNPALRLGALLGAANRAGVDKVVLTNAGAQFGHLGDWAEQLIAESTGKDGKGILPIVVAGTDSPNFAPSTPDEVLATYGPPPPDGEFVFSSVRPASSWGVTVNADLGGQLLLWEFATAVVGRVIGINPFDQPDVESAKGAARDMLEGGGSSPAPAFVEGAVTVYASDGWLPDGTMTVAGAVDALLSHLDPDRGYLAVQAYLHRHRDAALGEVRDTLAARTGRPVTFGWGPRFLHSTGQYHKGGPPTGVYLQVTGQPEADLAVPDRPFTFQEFLTAQAVGDGQVLADHGRPVLRLHVSSPADLAVVRQVLA